MDLGKSAFHPGCDFSAPIPALLSAVRGAAVSESDMRVRLFAVQNVGLFVQAVADKKAQNLGAEIPGAEIRRGGSIALLQQGLKSALDGGEGTAEFSSAGFHTGDAAEGKQQQITLRCGGRETHMQDLTWQNSDAAEGGE